jgi:hypothetical protein
MGRTRRNVEPLPTIWVVDDRLWGRIEPIFLDGNERVSGVLPHF